MRLELEWAWISLVWFARGLWQWPARMVWGLLWRWRFAHPWSRLAWPARWLTDRALDRAEAERCGQG